MLLDVSAADVWASFYTGVEVALAHFGRHVKKRAGHRAAGQPYPRTIYRCMDGFFAIQCGESRHWQGFLRMIGREDLATHALFSNRFKANDDHGDACDALVEPWFASRTKEDVLCQCLKHRIPGAPVYDIAEVYGHPHLNERGYFVPASLRGQTSKLPGHPYGRLDAEPSQCRQGREAVLTSDRNDALRPLKGLRVLDFGWVWAGAVPGHILADMGAEVIKIESAKPLDYMRQGRPIVGTQKDPEQNPMFQNVNRGKLSLCINFDHAETRKVLEDLVAVSDVVIENFSPGVMEKFGLNYPKLKKLRPDLVMCSMSAVGQHGPLRGSFHHGIGKSARAHSTSEVTRAGGGSLEIHIYCLPESVGCLAPARQCVRDAQVFKQHRCREHERSRIRHVFPGDVGCGSVTCVGNGGTVATV